MGQFYLLAKPSYANRTSLPDLFVFYVKLAIYKGYIPRFSHCAHVHPSINSLEKICFLFGVFFSWQRLELAASFSRR